MVLKMVSQPAMTKQMAVCARSVQLMVENMVSQPARTKEMAVCAKRYGNLLDQTTLFYKKKKKNLWLKLPISLPPFLALYYNPDLGGIESFVFLPLATSTVF